MTLRLRKPRRERWQRSPDPDRTLRAEHRAEELLREVVGRDDYAMYRELGFLRVFGNGAETDSGYAYLIYPHRPLIAYSTGDGELLSEYCVGFRPPGDEPHRRLPDADDVLAKWLALHGDERRLIADSNLDRPGHQVDPWQVRRDLRRLHHWDRRRVAAAETA
jgi:hypothetical protein